MKKIIFNLLISTLLAFADTISVPNANYEMDECIWDGSNGDVKDSSGNEYDGTSYDTNTIDAGVINRRGDFSAEDSSDYLSLPSDILDNKRDFSLSIWIQTGTTKTQQEIFQAVRSNWILNPKDEFEIYLNDEDKIVIKVKDESKTFNLGDIITDNKWHQIFVTKERSDVCLYLDGTQKGCIEYDDGSVLNISDGGIIVGQEQDSVGGDFDYTQSFVGFMDELKIFSQVLAREDIEEIYKNEADGKNYDGTQREAVECSYSSNSLLDYHMDECSWDDDQNSYEIQNYASSGNDYNATALNNANTTEGKVCRAGDLNTHYIQLKNSYSLTDWSTTFWVEFPLVGSNNQIEIRLRSGGRGRGNGRGGVSQQNYKVYVIASVEGRGDLGLFLKDSDNNYRFAVYDNDGDIEVSDEILNLSDGWHFFAMLKNSDNTSLYIDGSNSAYSVNTGTQGNLSLIGTSTDSSNDETIGAVMDEFTIFSQQLTSVEIQEIYNNEKSGKNYDGSIRLCNNCNGDTIPLNNYKFDAWDIWRNINDRNISTKIVSESFDLTIASLNEDGTDYQEFNGTVCATVDTNTSKALFRDQNTSTLSFIVSKAVKDLRVNLSWIKNVDTDCPLTIEDNSTNSSDNFAIRPKSFILDINSSELYAGESFTIYYRALNINDINSSDYNTSSGFVLDSNKTLQNCGNVTFSSPTFSNGGSIVIENIDSIGDINITLQDANNSNSWAAVDSDDTNDSQRLITGVSKIIRLNPYDINITNLLITKSTTKDWLYMAKNIKDMNITLRPTIEVFSKNGIKLQEYNGSCYAEDMNVTFYYDVNCSDDLNLTLEGNLTSLENNIEDINKTLRIPKELFIAGEANSSYSFGVERVYNNEKNITFIRLYDINITSKTSAKYQNGMVQDDNTSFYYGQLYFQDLSTSQVTDTTPAKILIYNKTKIINFKEELLHWYIYTPHTENDGNITNLVSSNSTVKPSSNSDGISASSNYKGDGIFSVQIDNPNKKESTHYIHLDIQDFLWYVPKGFGKDYNDSIGSSCSEHPCIEYKYGTNTRGGGVNSGTTSGVSFELNTSKNSRGVRLYR